MADPKKPDSDARRKLTGQHEMRKPENLEEKFKAQAAAASARAEGESTARIARAQDQMHHDEATQLRMDPLIEVLNRRLDRLQPAMQGRFSQGASPEGKPAILFALPPHAQANDASMQEEVRWATEAFGMLNKARLSDMLAVTPLKDGTELCISSVGSRAADFPIIQHADITTALFKDHAGRFLDLCVGIDAFNRMTPKGQHPFNGSDLWSEFRKQHPDLTIVDEAALGGAKFRDYDLSRLTFGPKAILKNASFAGADISGADFRKVRGLTDDQFAGAIADAQHPPHMPSHAAKLEPTTPPAPVVRSNAHRPDPSAAGTDKSDKDANAMATEWLDKFRGGKGPGR